MFEEMTVGQILRDLRSIKVPKDIRKFIDKTRDYFESKGNVPDEARVRLRRLCVRYKTQMKELHAARARARKTNGLRALGVSKAEAERRIQMRKAAIEARARDVGF